MNIDINQKKISIGDKYNIFVNQEQKYSASTELFKLLSVINLFFSDESRARITIKKQWSWLGPKYNIVRYDNNTFYFKTLSFWRLRYQCQVEDDIYNIYGHTGRKYSIFKNSKQVAWWTKAAVTWFEGDNYSIIADDDAEFDLIISFCLI